MYFLREKNKLQQTRNTVKKLMAIWNEEAFKNLTVNTAVENMNDGVEESFLMESTNHLQSIHVRV